MQDVEPWVITLFIVLFGMVLIWFGLMASFLRRLEANHPKQYEALGKPTVFTRNNIANSGATLKFLLLRRYRALNDADLTYFANGMVIYFAVYTVLFALVASQIVLHPHAAAP